jgi:hypothetical protein
MTKRVTQDPPIFIRDAKSLAPEVLGLLSGLFAVALALYLGYLMTSAPIIKVSDYIQLLVLIVIAATLMFSIHVQKEKEKFDESQAFLDTAISLINKAYDVLSDGGKELTTDRVSWVTAARLLTRSSALASRISLQSHQVIYDSEHDFQRHKFGDLLRIDGESLPVEFFFGTGYEIGNVGKSAFSTIRNEEVNWLPVQVVSTVYQFSSFPEGYEDPLNGSKVFNSKEMMRMSLFDNRGVHDYVVFRNYFTPVGTKILQKKGVDEPVEVSATDINRIMPTLFGVVLE